VLFFQRLEPFQAARESSVTRSQQNNSAFEANGDQCGAFLDSSNSAGFPIEDYLMFVV
jgi:hypothetical protein